MAMASPAYDSEILLNEQVLGQQITEESVREALTLWSEGNGATSPLNTLIAWQVALESPEVSSEYGATDVVLRRALATLAQEHEESARILMLRFDDGEPGHRIASILHIAEGTVWRKQREAIGQLTSLLLEEDKRTRAAQRERFVARLSQPAYGRLFGIAKHVKLLAGQLLQPEAPWLLIVVGIGGIGKTTLADAVTRQMLGDPRWHDFAWVTCAPREIWRRCD